MHNHKLSIQILQLINTFVLVYMLLYLSTANGLWNVPVAFTRTLVTVAIAVVVRQLFVDLRQPPPLYLGENIIHLYSTKSICDRP